MIREDDLTPEEHLEILSNTVKALHRQIADMIHLSARVDGLELMVIALGGKLGWRQEQTLAIMRRVQNTIYQKRLERVETQNPAAAASADYRVSFPDIDEAMLKLLEFTDEQDGLDSRS